MMAVQGAYLQKPDGTRVKLSEESAELLGFVDMLVHRRAVSAAESQSDLPALKERRQQLLQKLRESRKSNHDYNASINDQISKLDRARTRVDSLRALIEHALVLRNMEEGPQVVASESRAKIEERLLILWNDLYGQKARIGHGNEQRRMLLERALSIGDGANARLEALENQAAELTRRRDTLSGMLRNNYQLSRDIGDLDKEIARSEQPLTLSVTLTPMVGGEPTESCVLAYDGMRKKSCMYVRGRDDEAKSLQEWVAWLEDKTKADDIYLYLEYRGTECLGYGDEAALMWGDETSESWLVPATLSNYARIYMSTGNPADLIYPVREYGAPFESFGNRRKVAIEELCARVDDAQKAGRAIYIPFSSDEERFLDERDTFVVRLDKGRIVSLESMELDRYRPVVPLRRYPSSEDGELPMLCADLEGSLWLVDLAAQRIDFDLRRTRDYALFDEGVDAGSVSDDLEKCCNRIDCWSVAGNYDVGGALLSASDRDEVATHTVYYAADGDPIRLRFFELRRDDGSYGNVLSRARRVLAGHGWEKDENTLVLDESGREVESVWHTPAIGGYTILGIQDLQRFILSFGSCVVVEGPDWLRGWHLRIAAQNVRKLHTRLLGDVPG